MQEAVNHRYYRCQSLLYIVTDRQTLNNRFQYTLNALCYLTKTITRLGTLGSFAKGLINQGIESTKIELPSFIQTYETTFLITTNNSFTGSVLWKKPHFEKRNIVVHKHCLIKWNCHLVLSSLELGSFWKYRWFWDKSTHTQWYI